MDPTYDERGRLLGKFVHRAVPANVLLGRTERLDAGKETFSAEMIVDPAHPFFFEHALDHIPSMMLIEAGRQLGIAVSHLFLAVPFDTAFAPTQIQAEFTEYAELDAPVSLRCEPRDKVVRRGRLASMVLDGTFFQLDRTFGTMTGRWTMMPAKFYERFRRNRRLAAHLPQAV
jgi:hypothetical protein